VHRHGVTSAEGTAFHLAGLLNAAERTGLATGPLTDYLVRDETTPPPAVVERAARAGVAVLPVPTRA
jgi:hypothetical protein